MNKKKKCTHLLENKISFLLKKILSIFFFFNTMRSLLTTSGELVEGWAMRGWKGFVWVKLCIRKIGRIEGTFLYVLRNVLFDFFAAQFPFCNTWSRNAERLSIEFECGFVSSESRRPERRLDNARETETRVPRCGILQDDGVDGEVERPTRCAKPDLVKGALNHKQPTSIQISPRNLPA